MGLLGIGKRMTEINKSIVSIKELINKYKIFFSCIAIILVSYFYLQATRLQRYYDFEFYFVYKYEHGFKFLNKIKEIKNEMRLDKFDGEQIEKTERRAISRLVSEGN